MKNSCVRKPYDTYVSLGYNCEVSFRIRDFLTGGGQIRILSFFVGVYFKQKSYD